MLLAYQIDGHGFYWEVFSQDTKTYLFTVEDDDFGDWLSQHRKEHPNEDVMVFPQEPYQLMQALHIELDKFFGNETYPLDDCEAIHDPQTPLDEFYCEGCKAFAKWTEGKTAGDLYNNARLWKHNVFLHNEVELVNV